VLIDSGLTPTPFPFGQEAGFTFASLALGPPGIVNAFCGAVDCANPTTPEEAGLCQLCTIITWTNLNICDSGLLNGYPELMSLCMASQLEGYDVIRAVANRHPDAFFGIIGSKTDIQARSGHNSFGAAIGQTLDSGFEYYQRFIQDYSQVISPTYGRVPGSPSPSNVRFFIVDEDTDIYPDKVFSHSYLDVDYFKRTLTGGVLGSGASYYFGSIIGRIRQQAALLGWTYRVPLFASWVDNECVGPRVEDPVVPESTFFCPPSLGF